MLPGHEECDHDITVINVWGRTEPYAEVLACSHDHTEPVQADDRLDLGPVVADYCHCCGAMNRRRDYR